jgi:hypothetical protein
LVVDTDYRIAKVLLHLDEMSVCSASERAMTRQCTVTRPAPRDLEKELQRSGRLLAWLVGTALLKFVSAEQAFALPSFARQTGERQPESAMHGIAKTLTTEDDGALASYLQSL